MEGGRARCKKIEIDEGCRGKSRPPLPLSSFQVLTVRLLPIGLHRAETGTHSCHNQCSGIVLHRIRSRVPCTYPSHGPCSGTSLHLLFSYKWGTQNGSSQRILPGRLKQGSFYGRGSFDKYEILDNFPLRCKRGAKLSRRCKFSSVYG
jgi:hypothetical protein